MNNRRWFLRAYGLLLQLYPSGFRQRFVPEMMELAEASEVSEWPLIFGDTSIGIVRCWVEGSPSTAEVAEANAYVPLGGYPVTASRLLHGFFLSLVILAGLLYAGYCYPPPCQGTRKLVTPIVTTPQAAAASTAVSAQIKR